MEYEIKEYDEVEIIIPKTVKDIKKYVLNEELILEKNNEILNDEYNLLEGDKIQTKTLELEAHKDETNTNIKQEELKNILSSDNETIKITEEKQEKIKEDTKKDITITFNNKKVKLQGQKDYIVVDVFNFIDYDQSQIKGTINLVLNGKKVGYTEFLNDGDIIELFFT